MNHINRRSFLAIGVATAFASVTPIASSQEKQKDSDSPLKLTNTTTSVWEMGIEVTVDGGHAEGIVATCPIPIDWPEQKVKVLGEEKSKSIGRVTYRELEKLGKQMVVTIPRLNAGDTGRVVVRLEVEKSWIEEPEDKSVFHFAKKPTGDLRKHLQPSPYIESNDKKIKELLPKIFTDEQKSAWEQTEYLFDWVRENVKYEFDEQIKSCLKALEAGVGDCEELSSLFIAICRAKGIPARAVWVPGHTYPEFYLETESGKGVWIPCQVAGAGHDFGRMPESKPILQKGDRFKVPGYQETLRYLQPTLTAKDASGTPKIKWILQPEGGKTPEATKQ